MALRTRLRPVPLTPEISLHLADDRVGLFEAAGGGYRSEQPPPFWAFAWAGGQALARYLLDHPDVVRGRRVLDLAAGGGLAAIAAARAGAARVTAVDRDPAAVVAVGRNAAANGVAVDVRVADAADVQPDGAQVVLAGDVCYTAAVTERMVAAMRRAARSGAHVLVGDPGRGYLPERLFEPVARYEVVVPAAVEDTTALTTVVWRLR